MKARDAKGVDRPNLPEFLDQALRDFHGRRPHPGVVHRIRLSKTRFKEYMTCLQSGDWPAPSPGGIGMAGVAEDAQLSPKKALFVAYDGCVLHEIGLAGIRRPKEPAQRDPAPSLQPKSADEVASFLAPLAARRAGSVDTMLESVRWFRRLLAENGVTPRETTPLYAQLKTVEEFPHLVAQLSSADNEACPIVRDGIGINFFLRALNRAVAYGLDLTPMLHVFRGDDLNLLRWGKSSKSRDEAWDVLVAALCAPFCTHVRFDEPDVRVVFDGLDLGLACKMPYRTDPKRHLNQIMEGVAQLERSTADYGLIMVNLVNILAHVIFLGPQPELPQGRNWYWAEDAHEALRRQVNGTVHDIDQRDLTRRIATNSDGTLRHGTRAVVFLGQTVTLIASIPSTVSYMVEVLPRQVEDGFTTPFLDRFQDSMNSLAHWQIQNRS